MFGMMPAMFGGGAPPMVWPATAAEFNTITGRTPTNGWLCEDASTQLTAAFGGVNLDVVTGSSMTFAASTAYGSKLAIQFANNTTDSIKTTSTSVFDSDGSTSAAYCFHMIGGTHDGTGSRELIGQQSGTNINRLFTLAAGTMRYNVNDNASGAASATITQSITGFDSWVWVAEDWNANLVRIEVRDGVSQTASISALGALGAGAWGLGRSTLNTADWKCLAIYRLIGSAAEGSPTATLSSLGDGRYL
jgi:hypothetical protein